MGAQIVNLEGTQYISDVPSVYYGATSSLVSKIDPFAGNFPRSQAPAFPRSQAPAWEYISIKNYINRQLQFDPLTY